MHWSSVSAAWTYRFRRRERGAPAIPSICLVFSTFFFCSTPLIIYEYKPSEAAGIPRALFCLSIKHERARGSLWAFKFFLCVSLDQRFRVNRPLSIYRFPSYKAGQGKTCPNTVLRRGTTQLTARATFRQMFGAAPPRDVTLLHVQPVAVLWGAPRRALGVRYCPGGVLIRSSDCHLR